MSKVLNVGDIVIYKDNLYFLFKKVDDTRSYILPVDDMDMFEDPKPLSHISYNLMLVDTDQLELPEE